MKREKALQAVSWLGIISTGGRMYVLTCKHERRFPAGEGTGKALPLYG